MGVLAQEIEATYEVLSKMGEGGMGAVYKVRHRFFDEIRVVKVMQGELEPLPELKERFLGEAKRGKQLRHPNLAEVIDFSIASDGTAYIVMEFVDGTNLREVLARNAGPLDYRLVVPIAEQALAALGFLHSRKFVHRDISPDNLMLTDDGEGSPRVKLIDLGIAKSLESTRQLTMAGKFIGKVQYASPEQFGGEVDGRSDLYSLAIVLYELLTTEKPVVGDNPMSIIGGHLSRPPRSFEETDPDRRVPPAVRQVILKALEKRPEDRYPTAAAFAEALRDAIPPSERRTLSIPFVTRPSETLPSVDPQVTEAMDWNRATSSDQVEAWEQFLERHPRSERAQEARTRLRQLEDEEERDWDTAVEHDTASDWRTFLATHPDSVRASKARRRLERLDSSGPRAVTEVAGQGAGGSGPGERVSPAIRPPPPTRRGLLVSLIAALLLVCAIAALWLRSRDRAPDDRSASDTMVSTPAETAGTTMSVPAEALGQLLINALPWGNVVSVRDAEGVEQLTNGPVETPVVLSLPAGDYKIRLNNPNSNTSLEVDATVKGGALSRSESELDRIDAEEYVDAIPPAN